MTKLIGVALLSFGCLFAAGIAMAAAPSSSQQVAEGAAVWSESCGSCHGDAGEGKGKKKPPVVGKKALARYKTAADLHRYIMKRMPKDDPGTLTESQGWAVTAWIAHKNGKLGSAVLSGTTGAKVPLH